MTKFRKCSKCKIEYPLNSTHFYRDKSEIGGFIYRCKSCKDDYKINLINRQMADNTDYKCSKCDNIITKTFSQINLRLCDEHYTEYNSNKSRLHNYNLTSDGYRALIEAQGGKCAICQVTAELCIDHDHKRGHSHIRQALCRSCNVLLGVAKENTDILIRAIHYLNFHNNKYQD